MPKKPELNVAKRTSSTQTERRALSEKLIVEATIGLVGQRGLLPTTLADVGEAAGYSRGLPAHLFGSKENLLARTAKALTNDGLHKLAPEGGLSALLEAILSWLVLISHDSKRARALQVLMNDGVVGNACEQRPALFAAVRELDQKARRHVRRFLEIAMQREEIRADVDIDAQAAIILATVRGLIDQWLMSPDRIELVRAGKCFVRDVRRNLSPEKVQTRKSNRVRKKVSGRV
jgi:AcrR family transcriptional regulator